MQLATARKRNTINFIEKAAILNHKSKLIVWSRTGKLFPCGSAENLPMAISNVIKEMELTNAVCYHQRIFRRDTICCKTVFFLPQITQSVSITSIEDTKKNSTIPCAKEPNSNFIKSKSNCPGPCNSVGWSTITYTKRSQFWFLVKGTSLDFWFDPVVGVFERGNRSMFLSLISLSLPPPPPLPYSLNQ